jgi:hypothetical protein
MGSIAAYGLNHVVIRFGEARREDEEQIRRIGGS